MPDQEGNVAPLGWVTGYFPVQLGHFNVNDRLHLVFAWEANWELPIDTDEDLLEAIGAENISYTRIDVDDEDPKPVLVGFYQIQLADAITLLSAAGVTEVRFESEGDPYVLRLDAAPPNYTEAVIYDENEVPVSTIEIEE